MKSLLFVFSLLVVAMVDGKVVAEKMIENHMKYPNWEHSMKDKITECANTANEQSDKCEVAGAVRKCLFEMLGPPPHRKH